MNVKITPSLLKGKISAIPSKSMAHRLLICAAFADKETEIFCPKPSSDITATAQSLKGLGAEIEYDGGVFCVKPITSVKENAEIDCGESGSTLRFLLPVVCALGKGAKIKLHGRLPERPLSPLWEELESHGCSLGKEGDILTVGGKLRGGKFTIRADVSSQFISGLLFATPLMEESTVELTGNVESAGYIKMTMNALESFGVKAELCENTMKTGGTYISPGKAEVEGDWSNAAFWHVANAMGSSIEIDGLNSLSAQGDRAVVEAIERIKAGNAVVDVKDIPDLVPILGVIAAVTDGKTEFINAGRLRIKESDRLKSVCNMLRNLGGDCTETENGLIIVGTEKLSGGTVDSVNDHRIAMSAAIAATVSCGDVTVVGAEAVNKSYPEFWKDYEILGGNVN